MEYRVNSDFNALYDDADDCYLRRLSLYATLRQEDYNALKGRPLGQRKSKNGLQSLQNLFYQSETSRAFVPDIQTPVIEEKDEQTPSTSSESLVDTQEVLVNGKEIQDLPIEYKLAGLKTHELPVIGFYIDERVSPGFTYRVRYVGSERHVFGGKPRMLQSIGMGYGKRMTFRGDTLNHNDATSGRTAIRKDSHSPSTLSATATNSPSMTY
uniref:Uncharacterized protein n=1 Tax=Pinctada fucata TaxID=50426 RepID=A0A194ALR1_PINFU